MTTVTVSDFQNAARRRLPKFLFEYIDGGAGTEVTLRRNVAELEAVTLRQRVMRDVSKVDLTVELLGQKRAMPVGLGPIGLSGMYARRGEVQAAAAAETANVPFALSSMSVCPIAEVADHVKGTFWFQLYMMRDRGFMLELLARAAAASCSALVFTVDMPVAGVRYRDYRSGLAGSPGLRGSLRRGLQAMLRPAWAWDVGVCGGPHTLGNVAPLLSPGSGLEDFFTWISANFDPSVTWNDLEFVRNHWRGPIVIKGILDPDDARAVLSLGADGIVVSNHGGRQLDGVASTACALTRISEAVERRMTVLVDGGVRSGLDVVRMLALGADGVLLGRAWAYALAAGGQSGVIALLNQIATEMRVAMSLSGCVRVADIGRNTLDEGTRNLLPGPHPS